MITVNLKTFGECDVFLKMLSCVGVDDLENNLVVETKLNQETFLPEIHTKIKNILEIIIGVEVLIECIKKIKEIMKNASGEEKELYEAFMIGFLKETK